MRADIGRPDPRPPGIQRLIYFGFCWLNRHPGVFRVIASILRWSPFLDLSLPVAARRSAVRQVLGRTRSFSNNSHRPKLIAADFLIGMDPGPTYDADRALFKSLLATLKPQVDADKEARKRIDDLKARSAGAEFDLVEDYLMWVVFAAIKPSFGVAADYVVAGSRSVVPDEETERRYLHEVRYVASHLLAGDMAPVDLKRRAEASAAALRSRIRTMTPELSMAWPRGAAYAEIERNAIGLAWVSHPVTVQSGAQAMQELLGWRRRSVYKRLRQRAQALGPAAWTDAPFRKEVMANLLELMRFRPVFTVLARDVPRATEFESGARSNPKCPAGNSLPVLSLSALFDPKGLDSIDSFCPHRDWKSEDDARYLMFGLGDRQCPAKDHAIEILTSALIGLLTLPRLRYAERWPAIRFDGPLISRMRLRLGKG